MRFSFRDRENALRFLTHFCRVQTPVSVSIGVARKSGPPPITRTPLPYIFCRFLVEFFIVS